MTPSGASAQQPPSRRIAEDLRRQIETGTLRSGAKLPSERKLAEQYGAARNTAREAVRLLAEQGLVTAKHGSGVFVRTPQRLFRFGSDRYSLKNRETGLTPFRLEAKRQGKVARIEVPSIERERPPADVAERLGVPADDESVVHRENHYFADDEPVQIVSTYLRWDEAQGTLLMQRKTGKDGIYGRLQDLGHVMTRVRDEISARMPTPEEAAVLELLPGVPVLEVLHTSLDQDGVPFEVSRYVHRADQTGLLYELPVEQED
ncbi:GntR family transcriptional regulator [Streptomyces sp. MPA0124]|uniref:GntR family transcriptional regulator n=1 Tax=unclassified Streptomyces TaxID=2593676 RepID=UPI00052A758A|nr:MULTISPECIES: GntR family transcriptional regulator [unclassified Streptomyces]AIV36480.1 GntR family transcriptional regulator [Streptomyces sp. CCM_MD2014]WKX21031.1 GntR family transcriptional regulator [Streptomyces sp. HUAS CX7]